MSLKIEIYTDGACSGNPGKGGYGIVMKVPEKNYEKRYSQGFRLTTNNRMELTAAIRALNLLIEPCEVQLYTDSKYLCDGITRWVAGWQRNGWRTADKKPVKNVELWQALVEAVKPHRIDWVWVKGHAGDPDNERADKLASDAALIAASKRA